MIEYLQMFNEICRDFVFVVFVLEGETRQVKTLIQISKIPTENLILTNFPQRNGRHVQYLYIYILFFIYLNNMQEHFQIDITQ